MSTGPWPDPESRIRPGLLRILAALEISGHPERAFRTLHVAGTNGKGSVAAFAAGVLGELLPGPVGLYTSPHLLSPCERIRAGRVRISEPEFSEGMANAAALSKAVERRVGEPLSWFEAVTWVACDWFRRRGVATVVMETGLGGRWDATTACEAGACAITTVGMDHAEWLGATLPGIAREKAGILRKGVPAVLGRMPRSAHETIRRIARVRRSPLWVLGREVRWSEGERGSIGLSLPGIPVRGIRLRAPGVFQRDNAAVAAAAAWLFARELGVGGDRFARAVRDAFRKAEIPGRFCPLPGPGNRGGWADGGHNPQAARALARELARCREEGRYRRIVALWSMLADKDLPGFLRAMGTAVDAWVAYPLQDERAASVPALSAALERAGADYRIAERFEDSWKAARDWAGRGGMTLVCGSLRTVADAYRHRVGRVP